MTNPGEATEHDAYYFIENELENQGWDTRNPTRCDEGRVYTQNECLSHPEIHKWLDRDRPENIVKITESVFWVIESKKTHSQLNQALNEAQQYAEEINKSSMISVKFITGVAGNKYDTFLVRSRYFNGKNWLPIFINEKEITGFLNLEQSLTILKNNDPTITDVQIDEKQFIAKADEINSILHIGAVNPHQRANVMAALLLSMLDDTQPNIDAAPSVLVEEINARVKWILKGQGKEEFLDYIKITLPSTEDNHLKFKRALVSTIQELNSLNIRSAMNSGVDVLGKFYEVFLKYANWAQDLGIVLTPRHITQFAAEVIDIGVDDIILDLTCGTGGFLVASFDYVKKKSTPKQLEVFKQNSLFGIEQDAGIASLAIVNMIFRGDGKNNIKEGNCFANFLDSNMRNGNKTAVFVNYQSANPPITVVLMNPPFALKNSKETETRFIDHALNQMRDGGILFSILPSSVMIKGGKTLTWKKETLLKNNTLLSVITFPPDLFYPIGVHSIGVFIKKGVPHPLTQNVFWIRALNDGLSKKKGKRLPNLKTPNDLDRVKYLLKAFLKEPNTPIENVPEFQKVSPINFKDSNLELIPEAYLDQRIPTYNELCDGVEQLVRETAAFIIKFKKEGEIKPDYH